MAANTAGICASFKEDILSGGTAHVFGTDSFKAALYLVNESLSPATVTSWASGTPAGELTGTGYTAGGIAVTLPAAVIASDNLTAIVGATAVWSWSGLTSSGPFDTVLLYNSSKSNKAVGLFSLGGSQNITAGTLTLTMPAVGPTTALIQLA
jgi:hypothetical protein